MKSVVLTQSDVNSESAVLVEWAVADGTQVEAGTVVCRAETTKAVIEVPAPAAGQLFHAYPAGATLAFNRPIAWLAENAAEAVEARQRARQISAAPAASAVKATKKARQLAAQHSVSLEEFAGKAGLVTEQDVYAKLGLTPPSTDATAVVAQAAAVPAEGLRVLVLGAGLGAMQVIDILLNSDDLRPVGCLDDDAATHGTSLFGVPVWGPLDRLADAWKEKRFDRAIISISTNIAVRKACFESCRALGIRLVNAIDPSARLNRGVVLGEGNVLCSQVHVGVATVIGDNNFISSHTSIEHHNRWGSHNTVGPACATSSRVLVGDEVLFGTGIFIQPGVGIGSRCRLASGAVLTQNIPAGHSVKMLPSYRIAPNSEAPA